MTRALLLGVYLPILALASAACWMLVQRLVLPAWRAGQLHATRMAIGLGALLAMAAHLWETLLYGLGRWVPAWSWLLTEWHLSVVGKVLILAGVVLTLTGLSQAETNAAHLGRVTALAVLLWAVGAIAAVLLL